MRVLAVGVAATVLASSYAFAPSHHASAQRHQLALSAVATIKGTVKWYNAQRGFGFIEVDDGGPDMYVHATGLTFQGPLIDGERLSFDTEIDPRTNKPKAVAVERVADEDAVAKPEPVSAKEAQVEEAPAKDTPIATVTRTVFDVPKKEKLHVASPPNETFQRSLLAASLANRSGSSDPASVTPIQSVDYDAAARLAYNAGGSGDFEDFKIKYLEDASAMVAEKHKTATAEAAAAAEAARLAKEAEEKRIAEEAAAKEAAAKAEAEAARLAKEAEEKRLAEEAKAAEEARLAKEAEQAQDAKARELGYPSAAVMKARSQPKSPEDEAALAARYGAMDLEERAFSILVDLGMIELHLDPNDPNRDTSRDDDDME